MDQENIKTIRKKSERSQASSSLLLLSHDLLLSSLLLNCAATILPGYYSCYFGKLLHCRHHFRPPVTGQQHHPSPAALPCSKSAIKAS